MPLRLHEIDEHLASICRRIDSYDAERAQRRPRQLELFRRATFLRPRDG
jgi:hypothetical protein